MDELKKSFLIADQDLETIKIIQDFIELHFSQNEIKILDSGLDLEKELSTQNYYAVFFDILIPKMNLKSLLDLIQNKKTPFLPERIIFISDSIDLKSIKNAKGEISYLPKPIDQDDLKEILIQHRLAKEDQYDNMKIFDMVVDSAIEVFNLTCNSKVQCIKKEKALHPKPMRETTAFVILKSDILEITLGISFDNTLLIYLIGHWLNEKIESLDDETCKAAGELSNQVAGLSKTKISSTYHYLNQSFPQLVKKSKNQFPDKGPGEYYCSELEIKGIGQLDITLLISR